MLHEVSNVSGFTPLLVMDVWEHAFLLDYKPAERPKYIEAFFANVDWQRVEERVRGGTRGPQKRVDRSERVRIVTVILLDLRLSAVPYPRRISSGSSTASRLQSCDSAEPFIHCPATSTTRCSIKSGLSVRRHVSPREG